MACTAWTAWTCLVEAPRACRAPWGAAQGTTCWSGNINNKLLSLSLATVSQEEQVKIRQSLTKMIEAREMAVDEASPLVLTVTTAPGAAVQETYKFPNAPDQTATATPIALTATLAENGEAIWRDQSYTGGLPGLMALKTGESAQSYVDANCKPTYQFFHDLAIPPRMAKSPPGGAYGVSVLTKNGIE